MGFNKLFKRKRTPFDELWKQAEGIPEGIKKQIGEDLSQKTKKILEKKKPKEIQTIINEAIEEINRGSIETMDSLIRKKMGKRKETKSIVSVFALAIIMVIFVALNVYIDISHKYRLLFVSDGSQYCYGIDKFEKEENFITLKGWFLELKSVQNIAQSVSADGAELMFALVPIEEANEGGGAERAVFMNVKTMKENRPDVNQYFSCEYDYSKCGFDAEVDSDKLDHNASYRLVVKPDASKKEAILMNVFIHENQLYYTDPTQSTKLDTDGTELDKIVKEGVRLISRPDYGCYVYQHEDKFYWITDEDYDFCEDGKTRIQYLIETTQLDNLPKERIEKKLFWSDIGDLFERHEITEEINCGKYRVSVRDIPKEYAITYIITGCFGGNHSWKSAFRHNYSMLF